MKKIFKRIDEVNILIKKEKEKKTLHNNSNNSMDIENNSQSNKDNENKDFKRYISLLKLKTLDDGKILIVYYSNK